MNLKLVLLLFVFAAQNLVFGQSNRSVLKEQTNFSTEGEVVHNIPLPISVRALLQNDPFVRETLQAESLASLPESWTKCSLVHLTNNDERDYIVIGQRSLTGAHATHFWVYRDTPQGMKLVLFAFADSLWIQSRRTIGLRNIDTLYYTAVSDGTIHYTFDGNRYRADHEPQYR
jgi:hypothetical protein